MPDPDRMRLLIVDNFDSFTHLLAECFAAQGASVVVRRSDRPAAALLAERPDAVVISPGPGTPEEAGCSLAVLRAVAGSLPVLGVCLGMQVMARAFGARVERIDPVHGGASLVEHDGRGVFRGLQNPMEAGRYHSLGVVEDTLPPALTVTARAGDVVMGLRHATVPLEGVQFHPESVLSGQGPALLANFLALTVRAGR